MEKKGMKAVGCISVQDIFQFAQRSDSKQRKVSANHPYDYTQLSSSSSSSSPSSSYTASSLS